MRWPSDKDLAERTTAEILATRPDLNAEQINHQRRRRGIHLNPAATARANASRGLKMPGRMARESAIALLEADGYQITKALPQEALVRIDAKPGQIYRAAVVCCTHFGNYFQQVSFLHDFYDYAEKKGIEEFWHAGDLTDGPDSMHPAMRQEHWCHTYDRALDYTVETYPRPKSGFTRLILGNHDESWIKDPSGSNVGIAVAKERADIKYIGRRAADVRIGNAKVYILHGAGGGAYARSYKLQKTIEGMKVSKRPDVVLLGNYHQMAHLPGYLGVEGFMLGCFEDQTPFLTGLAKEPVIGGLIFELELGQRGLRDVRVEWRMYRKPLKGDHPK